MRPSALRLTSRILKLTGFFCRKVSQWRGCLPPPSSDSRPLGLSVSCVCLGALPCSGQMGACLCLCAPDLCLDIGLSSRATALSLHVSALVLSLGLCCLLTCRTFSHLMGLCVPPPHAPCSPLLSLCVCVCFYVQPLSHLHPPSFSKLRRKTSEHLSISIPSLSPAAAAGRKRGTESPESGRHLGRGGVLSRIGGAMVMGLGMGEPRTKADGEQGREYLPYVPGIPRAGTGEWSSGGTASHLPGTGARWVGLEVGDVLELLV